MLNILLSALLDPDRRLRSFRRSERLASILVRRVSNARLGVASRPHVRNKDGSLRAEERCIFDFSGGRPGACYPSDVSASLDSWYFSFAGFCLVGINPRTTYSAPPPQTLLPTEEARVERECDCSDCLGKMVEVIGHIGRFRPHKHVALEQRTRRR